MAWALDFQFDSTIDNRAVKIASVLDEHSRESLLHIVGRSITGERLVDELVFAAAGEPPVVPRMDNGRDVISQALQAFCEGKAGLPCIRPVTPRNNGHIEAANNRLRRECLKRNHRTSLLEACVLVGNLKYHHNHRHRHSTLGSQTRLSTLPNTVSPTTPWPARSTEIAVHTTRFYDRMGRLLGTYRPASPRQHHT